MHTDNMKIKQENEERVVLIDSKVQEFIIIATDVKTRFETDYV